MNLNWFRNPIYLSVEPPAQVTERIIAMPSGDTLETYPAKYMRVRVGSKSRSPVVCRAYVTSLLRVEPTSNVSAPIFGSLPLLFTHFGRLEAAVSKQLPQFVDVACVTEKNELRLCGIQYQELDAFLSEHGLYLFEVTVVSAARIRSVQFKVGWTGQWNWTTVEAI